MKNSSTMEDEETQQNCEEESFSKQPFAEVYMKCKTSFAEYLIQHKDSLKLLIKFSTLKKIKASDYIKELEKEGDYANEYLTNGLTPLPYKSMRKMKSEKEKKDVKKLERNAVLMRQIEYTLNMKRKKLRKRYANNEREIILIQSVFRGYLIRSAIIELEKFHNSLLLFVYHIMQFAVIKRKQNNSYCYFNGNPNKKFNNAIYQKNPLKPQSRIKAQTNHNATTSRTSNFNSKKGSTNTSNSGKFKSNTSKNYKNGNGDSTENNGGIEKSTSNENKKSNGNEVNIMVSNLSLGEVENDIHLGEGNFTLRSGQPSNANAAKDKKVIDTKMTTMSNISTNRATSNNNTNKKGSTALPKNKLVKNKDKSRISNKISEAASSVDKKSSNSSIKPNKSVVKTSNNNSLSQNQQKQNSTTSNLSFTYKSKVKKRESAMVQTKERYIDSEIQKNTYTNQELSLNVPDRSLSSSRKSDSKDESDNSPMIRLNEGKKLDKSAEKRVEDLIANKKVTKGEEIHIVGQSSLEDEKEVNLSEITDGKKLLKEKFPMSNIERSNQNSYLTKDVVLGENDEKILQKIVLIQKKYKEHLNSNYYYTLDPNKTKPPAEIKKKPVDYRNSENQMTKRISNYDIDKVTFIQKMTREYLIKSNFYGKNFNRLKLAFCMILRNRISFSARYFVYRKLKFTYAKINSNSTGTILDDCDYDFEREMNIKLKFDKFEEDIQYKERIMLNKENDKNLLKQSQSSHSENEQIIINDDNIY